MKAFRGRYHLRGGLENPPGRSKAGASPPAMRANSLDGRLGLHRDGREGGGGPASSEPLGIFRGFFAVAGLRARRDGDRPPCSPVPKLLKRSGLKVEDGSDSGS